MPHPDAACGRRRRVPGGCRAAHWQGDAIAKNEFLGFNGIARRVDVRVGRALEVIDDDMAARPERETRVTGDLRVGLDAHREHDEVGLQDLARLKVALERVGRGHETLDTVAERDANFMVAQFAFQQHRHFLVELRQHLLLQFDKFDRQALMVQLLGHFQADEAGADGHGTHPGLGRCDHAVHVFQ